MKLHVEIITPDETVYDGEADAIGLTTSMGDITVLPHHIPLIATLQPGAALIRLDGKETYFAVSGGVAEITGTGVRVLAQSADRAEMLEEQAIERAKEQAEKLLTERRHDAEGFADAVSVLDRELAKLKTVRRHRRIR
jgi:F-type H+-transporting ATPase subunit epsilon